jgi:transcriptional/translational regulatory protein YebC/TACO1
MLATKLKRRNCAGKPEQVALPVDKAMANMRLMNELEELDDVQRLPAISRSPTRLSQLETA